MAAIEPKIVTLKNGRNACVRTRTPDDSESVIKFFDSVLLDDRFSMITLKEFRDQASIEKANERAKLFYEHDDKLLLVTEIDGQIVSMSDIECGKKQRNRHLGHLSIGILPDYRNKGLGTAIMQTMIDWAISHPIMEKLELGVWAANTTAIRLYEKLEFKEEGRKINNVKYADGTYDDCVCMYRFVKQT